MTTGLGLFLQDVLEDRGVEVLVCDVAVELYETLTEYGYSYDLSEVEAHVDGTVPTPDRQLALDLMRVLGVEGKEEAGEFCKMFFFAGDPVEELPANLLPAR